MKYEIVQLEKMTVVGISAKTSNNAPDMHTTIGGLWNDFYGKGIYQSIPDKTSGKAIELYTDYENEEKGDYTVMVACETKHTDNLPENMQSKVIPAGRYAKFIVKGNYITACTEFWKELWQMYLPRSFVCDFEEYQNSDLDNCEIHFYIGLK